MKAIKTRYNLYSNLVSCHTAIIDAYVIEGHIPANDIQRFLQQKPNVKGLTIPGMPLGTPGMKIGEIKESFDILKYKTRGKIEIFKHYENY